jgi:hypothetical protein
METFFSLLLYLGTFVVGLCLDNSRTNSRYLRLYTLWLYIFLCFGYMTGSDWRSYELDFYYTDFQDYIRNIRGLSEVGFWFVFFTLKTIFRDFFIVIGILKALYLYSLIKFLKTITDNWTASISILLPKSLVFMLIDNPLRFMTALIFVNWALYLFLQGKQKKGIVVLSMSVLFHNTCIILLPIFLFFPKFTKVLKFNNVALWVTYLAVFILFSDGGPVGSLLQQFQSRMVAFGAKDYSAYTEIDEEAIFTLGSILSIFIFTLLLLLRKKILSLQYGDLIFSCSVLSSFMGRILIFIPTGFRLGIPLGYFSAIAFASIICKFRSSYYAKILLVYFLLTFSKALWTSYSYLPYSNAIPYILTSHKPYLERVEYNYSHFMQRMGNEYYRQK